MSNQGPPPGQQPPYYQQPPGYPQPPGFPPPPKSGMNGGLIAFLVLGGILGSCAWGGLVCNGKKMVERDQQIGTASTIKAGLPDLKLHDDVDKISISNARKGEVVLQKKGEKWELSKPLSFAANPQSVKSLLDNLKELKATDQISPSLTDDQKKEFQLDAEHGVRVVAWKGAERINDITFGKSAGRGHIAAVDGNPGVFSVSGYSSYLYTREVKGWRDAEIFKFDDGTANAITITNKNGAFSFTKGDKWTGTYKGAPIDRFDEDKVKDLLRTFKSLNADDFADGKSAADTGLDRPEATVTITLKDSAGKFTLNVGKIHKAAVRYGQKEGSPTIVMLPASGADWSLADVSKFRM